MNIVTTLDNATRAARAEDVLTVAFDLLEVLDQIAAGQSWPARGDVPLRALRKQLESLDMGAGDEEEEEEEE